MAYSLKDKHVLIVGGSSDIAAALATDLLREGARVTLAGRDIEKTAIAAKAIGDAVRPVALDLSDEGSIQAAADQVRAVGALDHLISVATERANGPVVSLERRALLAAFDAKVLGPILLAKHFAPMIVDEGSLLFFSGLGAWRPSPGGVAMAATNGSVSALASALAVELAPIRVNAISPGVITTSAWNTAVPDKHELFQRVAASAPARRVGEPSDVSAAARALLTNPFITGEILHVDGGARWA
ncbi:SDR family oxidoreductase [Microbispora bryophytorum]|uniref:SDR family oxidoreductase n=1 Tax=Microbispora bryophytorum subsp. camponoti TaxID=1677852 RepID=A0ABR8LCH2_9ACTN|nr:SDR family oxidoreductase [Microbispora camponoti]MBD3148578.1 SDR family oxidoreductase [Microbispora camponoti]